MAEQEATQAESFQLSSREAMTTVGKRMDGMMEELRSLQNSKLDASAAVTQEMVARQMVKVHSMPQMAECPASLRALQPTSGVFTNSLPTH